MPCSGLTSITGGSRGEQGDILAKAIEQCQAQLRRWLQWRSGRYTNRAANNKTMKIINHLVKLKTRTKRPWEIYSKIYYSTCIQPKITSGMAIADVTRKIRKSYENETLEIKEEIWKIMTKNKKVKKKRGKASAKDTKQGDSDSESDADNDDDPLSRRNYIEQCGPALQRILEHLSSQTGGWHFSVLMGGPDPLDTTGNLIMSLHIGKTNDGHDFSDVYTDFDTMVVAMYGEYLGKALNNTSSLPVQLPSAGGGVDGEDIDRDDKKDDRAEKDDQDHNNDSEGEKEPIEQETTKVIDGGESFHSDGIYTTAPPMTPPHLASSPTAHLVNLVLSATPPTAHLANPSISSMLPTAHFANSAPSMTSPTMYPASSPVSSELNHLANLAVSGTPPQPAAYLADSCGPTTLPAIPTRFESSSIPTALPTIHPASLTVSVVSPVSHFGSSPNSVPMDLATLGFASTIPELAMYSGYHDVTPNSTATVTSIDPTLSIQLDPFCGYFSAMLNNPSLESILNDCSLHHTNVKFLINPL
ncbi:hypothetical protein JVU11DRAFT_2982 [Chiua virens]|nr:hypothetical protein JVU11DRAFT_2982 [Chiua virens]